MTTSGGEIFTFTKVIPREFTHTPLASGAESVANVVTREFPPQMQTVYSYEKSREIKISVASDESMLDGRSMYLRFRVITNLLSANQGFRMSEGGAHNFFSRIELTDTAGLRIADVDGYDIISDITNSIYMSEAHTDSVEWVSGDSINPMDRQTNARWVRIKGLFQFVALDPVNQITRVAATDANPLLDVEVGDLVKITTPDGTLIHTHLVVQDRTLTTIIVDGEIDDIPTNSELWAFRNPSEVVASTNVSKYNEALRLQNSDSVEFNMRLNIGLLNIPEDIPLFLLNSLVFKFTLRPGVHVFLHDQWGGALANPITYEILEPRIVAKLRVPSTSVRETYLRLYSEGKLMYAYPEWERRSNTVSGEETNSHQFTLSIAKSSIRRAFFVVMDEYANSTTPEFDGVEYWVAPSVHDSHKYIDGGIVEYQYRVGSRNYPDLPVQIYDTTMSEAWAQLLKTFNIHNNLNATNRIGWNRWMRVNPNGRAVRDPVQSHKAIFCTSFAQLENDPASGIKTKGPGSDPHITLTVKFDGRQHTTKQVGGSDLATSRYFHHFLEYTKILVIRSGSITTFL